MRAIVAAAAAVLRLAACVAAPPELAEAAAEEGMPDAGDEQECEMAYDDESDVERMCDISGREWKAQTAAPHLQVDGDDAGEEFLGGRNWSV